MTHEQIRQMVRRANPVPDPYAYQSLATSVLTEEQERMHMQTDGRVEVVPEPPTKSRRGVLLGLATAGVVLLVGLVFLLGNDTAEQATPIVTPKPVPETDTPVRIGPGAYFIDVDGVESTSLGGTFVIEGQGWNGVTAGATYPDADSYVSLLVASLDALPDHTCHDTQFGPPGATAQAQAERFAAIPEYIVHQAPEPVTAYGYSGYHVLLEVGDEGWVPGSDLGEFTGCDAGNFHGWGSPTFGRAMAAPGQKLELWFLDVGTTPIMVEASWFQDTTDLGMDQLEAVRESLVITP